MSLAYTPLEEISKTHEKVTEGFAHGAGKLASIEFRRNQLLQLAYAFQDNLPRWEEALFKDLGRHRNESYLCDLATIITEAAFAYKNVSSWAKNSGPTNWLFSWFPLSPTVRKEPVGSVLVILPFNFPAFTLAPLVGVIAAGCPAVIKPSELAPATAALFAEIFPKYLDQDVYRVVNGGVEETTKLLELKWDHIVYTGSGRVGRVIATAAAKHLTPVTLELGGKCPVFIDAKANLASAAKRILWGKYLNAGQACVAPDYVLLPEGIVDKFVEECKKVHNSFYPEGPKKSESFARIISEAHAKRLEGYLKETKGEIYFGGEVDVKSKYVAPTLVKNVAFEDALMSDEIFGPILPLVCIKDVTEGIRYVNAHDKPLSLYIFSDDAAYKKSILDNTNSGGVMINDVVMHSGCQTVPFGGVGASGYGRYKGKYSFDAFTHLRPVLTSPRWLDYLLGFRFPPYTDAKANALKKQFFPPLPSRPRATGTIST